MSFDEKMLKDQLNRDYHDILDQMILATENRKKVQGEIIEIPIDSLKLKGNVVVSKIEIDKPFDNVTNLDFSTFYPIEFKVYGMETPKLHWTFYPLFYLHKVQSFIKNIFKYVISKFQ